MTFYAGEPNTPSEAVNKLLIKLNKERRPARVNLPALARRDERFMKTWLPPKGHIFVSSDFSSLEPSITAHFSKDPYYRYATYEGIGKRPYIDEHGILMIDDIYLMTASQLPGLKDSVLEFFSDPRNCDQWLVDSEKCKNSPMLKGPRKKAKPAFLGFSYNMGPKRFVTQCYDAGIDITLAEAKAQYAAFWALFSGVKRLSKTLNVALEKQGFFVNPFGYRLTTEPHKAFNAVIQSTASGVVDLITLEFFKRLPEARFICLIHDEFVYSIPKELEPKARQVTKECVDWLNDQLKWDVPMRLGFQVANNFAEMK